MQELHLEIVTPDGLKFRGDVESITVKTVDGDVEILAHHADYFATLGTGKARLLVGGERRYAAASGGFISVTDEGVRVVATTFEFADEIDLERAKRAKEEAESRLEKASDDKMITIAKAKLRRAASRINVAELLTNR